MPCTGHKFIAIPRNAFFGEIRAFYSLGPPKVPIGIRACWREAQAMSDPSCRRLA
ncbi:hypothetical protein ES705_11015 [subsurface metagenome]